MRVVTPWLDLPNVPDAWCRRLTACHAGAQTAGAFFPRPRHEITQVHDLALTALARGRVMVIYIDGLGYSLYRRATLPAIKKRFRCRRVFGNHKQKVFRKSVCHLPFSFPEKPFARGEPRFSIVRQPSPFHAGNPWFPVCAAINEKQKID